MMLHVGWLMPVIYLAFNSIGQAEARSPLMIAETSARNVLDAADKLPWAGSATGFIIALFVPFLTLLVLAAIAAMFGAESNLESKPKPKPGNVVKFPGSVVKTKSDDGYRSAANTNKLVVKRAAITRLQR